MKKKTLFTPKIVQTICNDPKKRREFMVNAFVVLGVSRKLAEESYDAAQCSYCGRSNREQIDTVS